MNKKCDGAIADGYYVWYDDYAIVIDGERWSLLDMLKLWGREDSQNFMKCYKASCDSTMWSKIQRLPRKQSHLWT